MGKLAVVVVFAAAVSACLPPSRTTAATQPTPAAFDATASDPRALAIADAAIAALGGHDRWTELEELSFELRYYNDGAQRAWFRHKWDRWNGRHAFAFADPTTFDARPPRHVRWIEVKYDLYDRSKLAFATRDDQPLTSLDAEGYIGVARDQLERVAYPLMILYKLRDPGTHLRDAGATPTLDGALDLCRPACRSIEVTFDPDVGHDTWRIDVNAMTHRPELIEKVLLAGRVAYRIDRWTQAGGLEWPSRLVNIATPSEVFDFTEITVGTPSDETYEKPIDREQERGTTACATAKKCRAAVEGN